MPSPTTTLERQELQAWLRLALTAGVGNAAARRLLARFRSPQAIFEASPAALQTCVSTHQAEQLGQVPQGFAVSEEKTWAWLQHDDANLGHALIVLGDPRYPESLLHTADPPLMLYASGPRHRLERTAAIVDTQCSLAIVGSRNPTPQGADNAYQFAKHLAGHGWCIVSGMALGVDAAAHEGALDGSCADVATVAVVGTGVDRIYPRQHQQLAQRLVQHGLILSEFPLGTPPIATNFPKRNRIISGLSRGTLVVEAALASGSLITARTASEQGREVFAIPGSIHSPQARGCHALIKQGAKLVEHAQDIVEELAPSSLTCARQAPVSQPTQLELITPIASPLLDAMGYDPVHIDSLSDRTGYSTAQLQAQLLELELEDWVERLPGGLYQRRLRT